MLLEDGRGRGNSVEVTDDHHLSTNSITRTAYEYWNRLGTVFSVAFEVTPSGPGQCFFYLRNTSEFNMYVKRIKLVTPTVGERIGVWIGDRGTPVGGTDISPVNLNTSSGFISPSESLYGVDITGLFEGKMADEVTVAAGGSTKTFEFESAIIIAPGTTMTLYAVAGSVLVRGSLVYGFDITND